MRMFMALLLGLYLAAPVRAADSGPVLLLPGLPVPGTSGEAGSRCADFLEEAGLKPQGLDYLFCRPGTDARTGRPVLTARYRVAGARAAAVETALRERTGMAALRRQLGIWQLPEDGEGRFVPGQADSGMAAGLLPDLPSVDLPDGMTAKGFAGNVAAAGDEPAGGVLAGKAASGGPAGQEALAVPADPGGTAVRADTDRAGGSRGTVAPGADSTRDGPAEGPVCTVSMGEVPQQGVFAATRDDWGGIAWFAVTVRLAVGQGTAPGER